MHQVKKHVQHYPPKGNINKKPDKKDIEDMNLLEEGLYEDTEAMETVEDKRRFDFTDPRQPFARSSFNSVYHKDADAMWERARPMEISKNALLTRSRFEHPKPWIVW